MEVSEITAREIKVEPRAFIGIELPHGWRVGVRANPIRRVAEVLKPILTQHSLKLDAVVVYDVSHSFNLYCIVNTSYLLIYKYIRIIVI